MQSLKFLQENLLAYYSLKGDGKDFSGNGRDTTQTGNPSFVPGKYGLAASFGHSGDVMVIPLEKFNRYANQYTLSAWIRLKASCSVDGEMTASGIIAGRLGINYNTGKLQFYFYYDNAGSPNNQLIILEGNQVLPVGEWLNVVISYDHSTRNFSFYVNGIKDVTINLSGTVREDDRPHLPNAFGIGGNYPSFSDHHTFNGEISDVCLFNITADQLSINCLAGYMNFAVAINTPLKEEFHEFNLLAIPVLVWVAVCVAVAIVVEEAFLVDNIKQQPKAPPPPREKTPEEIASAIRNIAGSPSQNGVYITREQIGIPSTQVVRIDLGGMGVYTHNIGAELSGLPEMINVNDKDTNPDSLPPNIPIPNLVMVKFNTLTNYPFADEFADYITMQAAPLTDTNVREIARMLRHGGSVGLWIDKQYFSKQIQDLASLLGSEVVFCNKEGGNLDMDEFKGEYLGYEKIIMTKPHK